jgi:hypothetical protein
MRINYWRSADFDKGRGVELVGLSIASAKRHLREKGGTAFSGFFDRKLNLLRREEISLTEEEAK